VRTGNRQMEGHTATTAGTASRLARRDPGGSAQHAELHAVSKRGRERGGSDARNQGSRRAGAPRAALSLVRIEAAMIAGPTTAMTMLHTAFISGLTPRRTSE